MAICSSGISQPKAGVAASVVVDQSYIQSLLPAGLAWAYPYLPYMHGLEIGSVASFCAADPPTWTVPTGSDILAFLTGGPYGSYLLVEQFLQNVTKAYLWYSLCECASVATPAPPAAPSAPSNLPAVNPPTSVLPPAESAAPCFSKLITTPIDSGTFSYGSYLLLQNHPTLTSVRVTINQGIPTGTTTRTAVTWTVTLTGPSNIPIYQTVVMPSGFNTSVDLPVLSNYYEVRIQGQASFTGAELTKILIEGFCGGAQPGSSTTGCCPPDPNVVAALRRLDQAVTLIQRQLSPFAYVYGDNHTGLTGDGEIAVSGLIGASADVTTLPSSYGRSVGTPEHLFDVGYMTLGTADGWAEGRRIDADGTLILAPAGVGAYTRIGYTLAPGVVVDIRELVREP